MSTPSLLRDAEHEELRQLTLSGAVLDLGGDRRSDYQTLFKGTYTFTTLNADPRATPDIVHDLEIPLPIDSATFDAVLLINVLEHIFHYQELLAESVRVLKPGGLLIVVVPLLFPVHPSPHDFYRFTEETLTKESEHLDLRNVQIMPLGGGVFSVCYLLIDRLLPRPLRFISYYTLRYAVRPLDSMLTSIARALRKKYEPSDYALGYCVTMQKRSDH